VTSALFVRETGSGRDLAILDSVVLCSYSIYFMLCIVSVLCSLCFSHGLPNQATGSYRWHAKTTCYFLCGLLNSLSYVTRAQCSEAMSDRLSHSVLNDHENMTLPF
jgi:hypothetical protein